MSLTHAPALTREQLIRRAQQWNAAQSPEVRLGVRYVNRLAVHLWQRQRGLTADDWLYHWLTFLDPTGDAAARNADLAARGRR